MHAPGRKVTSQVNVSQGHSCRVKGRTEDSSSQWPGDRFRVYLRVKSLRKPGGGVSMTDDDVQQDGERGWMGEGEGGLRRSPRFLTSVMV